MCVCLIIQFAYVAWVIILSQFHGSELQMFRNDPKFLDRQVWANSVDPDQTAPTGAVWSGSTLFACRSSLIWV